MTLALLFAEALSFPPRGFGSALPDFAFFVIFAYYADANFRPATAYRWVFFVLCVLLALLFFIAWIADLGGHL